MARFVIKGKQKVRKGKLKLTPLFPSKGMKITIKQQSHRINEQSHSSIRHEKMCKKALMNLTLHAQTFRCPLGILIFVWLFGNFNLVGPAATPLRPTSSPAADALTAARARVHRQRHGSQ
jgi:hypothetical protein